MSDRYVQAADAIFVQDRLPRLRRLLRSGWVEWAKLDAFVRDTECLDLVVAHAVERIILGDLEPDETLDVVADPAQPGLGLPAIVGMTLPQLRAAIAAAIAAIDAEAAARRAKAVRAARRVRSRTDLDGGATLTAELTVEAAAAVWNALTAAAKTARAAGDPRSLDQLRADVLVARTTGTALPPPAPGDTPDVPDPENVATLGDVTTSGDPTDLERCGDPLGDEAGGDAGDRPRPASAAARGGRRRRRGPHRLRLRGARRGRCRRGGRVSRLRSGTRSSSGPACRAADEREPHPAALDLPRPAEDPGGLDGYGPVAAGLARQIIADVARRPGGGGRKRDHLEMRDHG